MADRRKLIEISIPLEEINKASKKQKAPKGYPTSLHKYWAQRPLSACRAVLFAQLVDDPSSWPERFGHNQAEIDAERKRLHKLIEALVPWEASDDEVILNQARWEIARSVAWGLGEEPPTQSESQAILEYLQTKAPPVYDPFSGSGSIPLEAQRLGLRAYGSDLNPVAVLIGKALVEVPPKFAGLAPVNQKSRAEAANGQLRAWKGAQGLAEDVRYYGQWLRDEAERRIAHLYPEATLHDGQKAAVIAWLWARTVRSPDPAAKGAMVPLISSFMLSTKDGRKAWAETIIDPTAPDGWRFEVQTGNLEKAKEKFLSEGTKAARATFRCVLTGVSIGGSYIDEEAQAGRMGTRLISVVAEGRRSRVYLSPEPEHEHVAEVAALHVLQHGEEMDLPRQEARGTFASNAQGRRYCFRNFSDYFTPRQLVALTTFSDLVSDAREKALADASAAGFPGNNDRLHIGGSGATAYADAVATYLAFMIDRAADYGSSLATWLTDDNAIRGTFGRQGLSMAWDFCEGSYFGNSSASLNTIIEVVSETLKRAPCTSVGRINQIDAPLNSYDPNLCVMCTDPPYYDNIGYADLSDFFYVWLRRSLSTVWPPLFRRLTTPKEKELIATPYRHSSKEQAENFFMEGMRATFTAVSKGSTPDDPFVLYYAFKQAEVRADGLASAGWASFLQALVNAGYLVDGTWPLRTESAGRLIGNKANALASSIVLVCRKRPADADTITRADFIRALKREMPAAIDAIRKAGVGPVDMQQSVIGPGMGVFSRHAKVLEDDDGVMSVKAALVLINRVWEEIENELDQAFDPATQVALAWFATYGFEPRASGELITLTTAKNTADRALFASGVFEDLRGKARLTPRDALPTNWSPKEDRYLTVWECVQHTARVLNAPDGGGEAAATLVAQMGPKSEEARALAYRLFEIATQKGWAAEALVYNELAQEWTKLEDRAAALGSAGPAPGSNQTAFAFEGIT